MIFKLGAFITETVKIVKINKLLQLFFIRHTVKSRAVDRSTIQFLTFMGVLLIEMCFCLRLHGIYFSLFKVVVMSASMNTQVFKSYLNNCPVIRVKGRQFDVQHHFLEDFIHKSELKIKMPDKFKLELTDLPEDYENEFGYEQGNSLRSIDNITVGR